MTELETLKRAKMYMDKLANGINPIDDTSVPDDDIINNVRLSRCFFYVSDVLRQVIENGGVITQKKLKKQPFSLSYEQRAAFSFSEYPISISEITKRLNALIDNEAMTQIKHSSITAWLAGVGMLEEALNADGKKTKRPTLLGNNIGISVEERTGLNGMYQVVTYNRAAQQFIVDNLSAILEAENEKTQMQGQPWSKEHDAYLTDSYCRGVSVKEIAITLKRNSSSIRARLKKLGLTAPKE